MPGYFLRSPPRSPRRALQFARLQEEEEDGPYLNDDPLTTTTAASATDNGIGDDRQSHPFKASHKLTSIPRSPRNALQFALLIEDDVEPEEFLKPHPAEANLDEAIPTMPTEEGFLLPNHPNMIPLLDDTTGSSNSSVNNSCTISIISTSTESKTKSKLRPSYPTLDLPSPSPSNTHHEESMLEQQLEQEEVEQQYSIHVEMATSAFLRNPCQELWDDLIRCLHDQYARELGLMATNGGDDSTSVADMIMEDDGGYNANNVEEKEGGEDEKWADFDNEMVQTSDEGSNQGGLLGAAPAEWPSTTSFVRDEEAAKTEDTYTDNKENVAIGHALTRLENSLVSLEEKAMSLLLQHHPSSIYHDSGFPESEFDQHFEEDESSMGDCWVERDVSPESLRLAVDEEKSNGANSLVEGGGSGGLITEKRDAMNRDASNNERKNEQKAVVPSMMSNESSKVEPCSVTNKNTTSIPQSKPMTYVLNEIQHWEKRIVQYDQSHVNVVAAALEQAAQGDSSWKVGQIVEVVPSSLLEGGKDEEGSSATAVSLDRGGLEIEDKILYVV